MLSKLRLNTINKHVMDSDLSHFLNEFYLFFLKVNRCHYDTITNRSANMSHHDACQDAHVLKMTLCVTFGAPLSRTVFRVLASPSAAQPPCHPPVRAPMPHITARSFEDRPRAPPSTPTGATSVGGGAMHMKIPDGIRREAGIGRAQNRKELSYSVLTRDDRPSVG